MCPNCGKSGPHFIPPSLGEEGFYLCDKNITKSTTVPNKNRFYLDNEYGIDALGEYLRNQFFDQSQGLGCYSSFEMREDVIDLDPSPVENFEEMMWQNYEKEVVGIGKVKMRFFWDGDGTLEFVLPSGEVLSNSDCKKNFNWILTNDQ